MILVVNAGSSNTKLAIYEEKSLEEVYRDKHVSIQAALEWLKNQNDKYKISAIGHRIVHGGTKFLQPVIITPNVLNELKNLIPLAPLHQPHNIAAIEELMQQYPNVLQIGCFDTAFHHTQEYLAKIFAIPQELTKEGVIRYGFHGLSYEYIASVLEYIGPLGKQKVIVAHLGNGSSMCAMQDLKSAATTMGFSALDGLMMGTRGGSIDPGVLLYLLQEKKYTTNELATFLYNKCGLLGVSNISNDVEKLLNDNSPDSKLAIDLYCYKAANEFAKLLCSIDGCDALIFTGGIGENAASVRSGICLWLQWFGVKINSEANSIHGQIISEKDSKVLVGVIKTNEEFMIAKHTQNLQDITDKV